MSRLHVLFHLIISTSVIYYKQYYKLRTVPPYKIKGKDVIKEMEIPHEQI